MTNSDMYLTATLAGHKQVVNLFKQMNPTQIKDAVGIGIGNMSIDVSPFKFPILCTTINDLFGPMVSAMTSFYYCVAINRTNTKLIATIVLSHAYALFTPYMSYDHWPKTAISEYLGYFEKIVME